MSISPTPTSSTPVVEPATSVVVESASFFSRLRDWLAQSWLTIREKVAASYPSVKQWLADAFQSLKSRVSTETWDAWKVRLGSFYDSVLGFFKNAATLSTEKAWQFCQWLIAHPLISAGLALGSLAAATLCAGLIQGVLLWIVGQWVVTGLALCSTEGLKAINEGIDAVMGSYGVILRAEEGAPLASSIARAKAALLEEVVVVEPAPYHWAEKAGQAHPQDVIVRRTHDCMG